MRFRNALALATLSASIVAAIVACSDAYDEANGVDGPGDSSTNDGSPVDDSAADARASSDAAGDSALLPLAAIQGPCPAAKFTAMCTPDTCETRPIYAPTEPEYPFSIVSDADYVYWASQPLGTDQDKVPAYNGERKGRILRVSRATGSKHVVLAEGHNRARAVALAGRHVYFGASDPRTGGGWDVSIRRVPRDCAAPPCAAEHVVALGAGATVLRLRRVDDDTLFAFVDDGTVFKITLGAAPVVTEVGGGLVVRTLTVTSNEAFYGSKDTAPVFRVGRTASAAQPFGTIPSPPDGGFIGAFFASDCSHVYGYRGVELVRSPVGAASFTHVANITPPSTALTFDVAVDEKYLYAARPNTGGLFAIDTTTGTTRAIAGGNVWEVHVDSTGVYWGEHDTDAPGALFMMEKR